MEAPTTAPFSTRLPAVLTVAVASALVWSAIGPYDRFTWFLEVVPVLLAAPVLVVTRRRFPLSRLAYTLIAIHMIILIIGGHYTYARVPVFDWIKEALDLERNHYDRVGHFAQGFVPAILARELLIRTSPLRPGRWMFVLITLSCLGISALYEFFEWSAAVLTGTRAEDFLGTQGDAWDTQKDMFLAMIGAMAAQILLGRVHDRQLDLTR